MGDNTITEKRITIKEGRMRLKNLRRIFGLINIITVIPLFIIAFYNVPSADDFTMAFEVHEAYLKTGSFLSAVAEAVHMGIWYYLNWTGYFFSDTLTALAPHVFGEGLYFLGSFIVLIIITSGIIFFTKQLLTRVLKVEDDMAGCITSVTYFVLIQCIPASAARCESFYWYSGAINYMFMLGVALLWLGAMIKHVTNEENKRYHLIWMSMLGFLLGGANYMTALSLAILSLCILFISVYGLYTKDKTVRFTALKDICLKLGALKRVATPSLFMLLGFLVSVVAPGNSNRSSASAYNPVKAIMISIYYTLEYMLGEWLTFPVICLLVIIVILMWRAAGKATEVYDFGHPALFSVFCILLAAANITPPVYVTGNIEAGRIQGIFYVQSMLLLVLMLGYICGWLRRKVETREKSFEGAFAFTVAVFVIGSLIFIKVNPDTYTCTAALKDVANGSAATYKQEFDDRLILLKDDSKKDISLDSFSVRPSLLFFSDITKDKKNWLNEGVAEYYHKNSVVLE